MMSSTMIPDVVGEVGFGSNFAPEAEFYHAECRQHELRIKDLEAEVRGLVRHCDSLRDALMRCAALSPEVSDKRYAVLLATDPKNR